METALHERMLAVVGARSYRAIAELTETNAETVRRYLQGQMPSVDFLASLCGALKINGEWLLCGRGPMRAEDVKTHALREATGPELLGALAANVEQLGTRMERVEKYMQIIDARVRGRESLAASESRERPDEREPACEPSAAPQKARRAQRIADAIAERSTSDAG